MAFTVRAQPVFKFASSITRCTYSLPHSLSVTSTRLYATKMSNPKVFFDISINSANAGRIVMEVNELFLF